MKRLVLAGGGHAHTLVLREWTRAPPAGVELVLVSPQPLTPYSGMVPGWLAGRYRYEDLCVDLPALCRAAGARWIRAGVAALDAPARRLVLDDGQVLEHDLLSLNVGSTLRPPAEVGCTVLALRPLAELRPRWDAVLAGWRHDAGRRPFVVTAVGGGAAGFEALLAVLARLRAMRPDRTLHGGWVGRGSQVLDGFAPAARRAALRAAHDAGVVVQLGAGWCPAIGRGSDLLLWATGAEAHDWLRDPLRRGGLDADAAGFVRVDARLRSTSHPQVFAAGDCAHGSPPVPKAGVQAVRMAPVLAHNLRAVLESGASAPLRAFAPRRHALALLSTADGRAIASRGRWGAEGRWVWRWKRWLDEGFVQAFPHDAAESPDGRADGLR